MWVYKICNQNAPSMCGHKRCTDLATGYIEHIINDEIYCIPVCDNHRNMLGKDNSIKAVDRVIKLLHIEYIENDIRMYVKANHDVDFGDGIDVSEGICND